MIILKLGSLNFNYGDFQILKPSDKKKFPYSGAGHNRPITPPRGNYFLLDIYYRIPYSFVTYPTVIIPNAIIHAWEEASDLILLSYKNKYV